MGETRNQALRAARPEDGVGLYFRSHLSCRRKRRRACPALLQQRGYGPASRGNLACGRARSTCARSSRSGRMACLEEAAGSRQHHTHPIAAKVTRVEPVENIWQFMRDNWLSNRVFKSYDDILDHCCFAWNKLIDMPWKIMSIGTREWAALSRCGFYLSIARDAHSSNLLISMPQGAHR